MPGTNKSSPLFRGLSVCSLQLCFSFYFLLVLNLRVNLTWMIRTFSGLPLACAQPCTRTQASWPPEIIQSFLEPPWGYLSTQIFLLHFCPDSWFSQLLLQLIVLVKFSGIELFLQSELSQAKYQQWGFPGSSRVKNLPAMQETQETRVQSLVGKMLWRRK